MEFTRHNMNFLVHNYMRSMGFTKAASVFDLESNLGNAVNITPPFTLIDILKKGLKYVKAGELIGKPEVEFQGAIVKIMEESYEDEGPMVSDPAGKHGIHLAAAGYHFLDTKSSCSTSGFKDAGWNNGGTLLAAGMIDGSIQLRESGRAFKLLNGHLGAVNAVRWNKRGNYVLSCGNDGSVLIWDTKSGSIKQKFLFHRGPVLNIDWRKNTAFASSGLDKIIYVCKINIEIPLKSFRGHNDQIYCIKWDYQGNVLASGSADNTLRLWSMKSCFTSLSHSNGVHDIAWSVGTRWGDNALASACYDSTVRIWDVYRTSCVGVMTGHGNYGTTLTFSHDGKLLASGGKDGIVNIWSTNDYRLIQCLILPLGVSTLRWNNFDAYTLQLCTTQGEVIIVDLRVGSNIH